MSTTSVGHDANPGHGNAGVALGPFLRAGTGGADSRRNAALNGNRLLFSRNMSSDHSASINNPASLGRLSGGEEVLAVYTGAEMGFICLPLDEAPTAEGLDALKAEVDAVLSKRFGDHPCAPDGYPVNRVLWWHCLITSLSLDESTVPVGLSSIARGLGGSFAIRSGRSLVEGHGAEATEVVRGVQLGLMAATATWIEADRADRLADDIDPRLPDPAAIGHLGEALVRCHKRLREARYLDGTARVAHEYALHEWTILGAVEGAMQRLATLQRDLELANEKRRKAVLEVMTSIATVVSAVLVLDFIAGPAFEITNPVRATIGFGAVVLALAVSLRLPRLSARLLRTAKSRTR